MQSKLYVFSAAVGCNTPYKLPIRKVVRFNLSNPSQINLYIPSSLRQPNLFSLLSEYIPHIPSLFAFANSFIAVPVHSVLNFTP